MEWKPIETAPRKGLIDLWVDGRRITGCWWDEICDEYRSTANGNVIMRIKNASYWRAVPEPPNSDIEGKDNDG